nr:MAG: hypothetical protein [Bacteriophage sp.]
MITQQITPGMIQKEKMVHLVNLVKMGKRHIFISNIVIMVVYLSLQTMEKRQVHISDNIQTLRKKTVITQQIIPGVESREILEQEELMLNLAFIMNIGTQRMDLHLHLQL